MKRILSIVLTLVLVSSALTACSGSKNNESGVPAKFDPSQMKTMGDVFAYDDGENHQGSV